MCNLTVVVAATEAWGIGLNGGLPWRLKSEMAYFARVTKAVPAQACRAGRTTTNAVIMGRKTWESIPLKFRPLKERINVVVSRQNRLSLDEGVLHAQSLDDALHCLKGEKVPHAINRIFIIGGAQLYQEAFNDPRTDRILLTLIHEKFPCDTFLPLALDGTNEWKRSSHKDLEDLVEGEVPQGKVREGDTDFEYTMWTKPC